MIGGSRGKLIFLVWGVLLCAVLLVGLRERSSESTMTQHAYDDVDELNQIIIDRFDDNLLEASRQQDSHLLEEVLSDLEAQRSNPTLDAPSPGAVIAGGGEASMTDKKEEPNEYVRGVIDPAKGVLLDLVEVADDEESELYLGNAKYDDAEWHYGGEFPEGMPISHGFTHIGFFLTWIVDSGLDSEFIQTESPNELAATKRRSVSPITLLESWDGKLVDDMLSEEGNAFAVRYYNVEDPETGYVADFFTVFDGMGAYEVTPTWENYDRIKPVIDRRYQEWLDGED